jgi:hypothetical protein
VHRFAALSTAAVLALGLAFAACGGNDETTTTETQTETATETATGGGETTTGETTQTTTGGQTPADCGSNQVFSQSTKACVDIREGTNPCPNGEVPMADRPVCVPKD